MRRRCGIWLLFAAALFGRAGLVAEESAKFDPGDLTGYLAHGIAHNPGLQAEYDLYRAALEKIPQARSLPDPMLTAMHMVEKMEGGATSPRSQIFLGQTFPWFGKRKLRGEVASGEAEAFHHAYEAKLLALVREIGLAYYDYAYLGKATGITGEILGLLEQLEESVEEKVRGGNDLAPLLRIQVEIGQARDMLQGLEKQRAGQTARIQGLLGRRPGEVLLPFPPLAEPDPSSRDREHLAHEILSQNPELRSLRSRIDTAADEVKLAKREPIPDPAIEAGTGDDPWAVQLRFSIPFWFGKYKAEQREAAERYQAAKKMLTDRENMLLAELEAVIQEFSEVQRRLELYGETLLPKARQAFQVTESSYRADRSTILDLIDSERTLLEIEKNYWRAVANHYQAAIRLQTLTGKRPQ